MASDASVTVVGRSAILQGDLSGAGDVQIEGIFEGSVQVDGARITVGPDARVRATLRAKEIIVAGRVEGELRASGRAELRAHSSVTGNIFAPRLAIEDDATLQGKVDCTPTAAPASGPRNTAPSGAAEPTAGAAQNASSPGAAATSQA